MIYSIITNFRILLCMAVTVWLFGYVFLSIFCAAAWPCSAVLNSLQSWLNVYCKTKVILAFSTWIAMAADGFVRGCPSPERPGS